MHRPAHALHVLASLILFFLAILAPRLASAVNVAEYVIEPAPAWLEPVARGVVNEAALEQVSGGAYYLLLDTQVRSTPDDPVTYRRTAIKAINAQGLQTVANVEIGFDPSYQVLRLHSLDLIRDGKVIRKLASATVRILQREADLERRIYDGRKTASIFLDDVRVGDTVDYAFSLRGRNPVFHGEDFGGFGLQFNVPVAHIHARLLAADPERMRVAPRNTMIKPIVADVGGMRSWAWRVTDAAPRVPDSSEPSWYEPDAAVGFSTYADWAAVAQWAVPLYAVPGKPAAALQAEIDRIARTASTPAERLRAVLQFVQGEIRYLGVEVGPGSHEPTAPAVVLERRFGDCKDKSLLMLAMLDRLGIEANAALVSTETRRGLRERLASPGRFDHVIVHARIDGTSYWLDPTRPTQKAELANLVQADFDLALVVDAKSRALTSMKPATPRVSKREVTVTIDARAGFEKPVAFTVVTHASGERAEALRNALATSNTEELQKSYLNFYAGYYPGIAVKSPFTVRDDEPGNRITMTERYTISDFTNHEEGAERHTATISAPDIDEMLRAPASTTRDAPLWRAHPLDVSVTTETLLPGKFTLDPETITIDDPAFVYERRIMPGTEKLVITDRYTSRSDEVAAADTVRYAGNLARARDSAAYSLGWPDPDAGTDASATVDAPINWTLLLIALMSAALWTWLARAVYRHDPQPIGIASAGAPRGLGGWLILPALGVLATPITLIFTLIKEIDIWSVATWASLTTTTGDQYDPMWAPVLLFTLVMNIGLVVFSILLLVLFVTGRTSTPRVFIAFLASHIVILVLDLLLSSLLPAVTVEYKDIVEVVRSAVYAVTWSAYFLKSERVKATFVRRLRGHAGVPVPRATMDVILDLPDGGPIDPGSNVPRAATTNPA